MRQVVGAVRSYNSLILLGFLEICSTGSPQQESETTDKDKQQALPARRAMTLPDKDYQPP